MSLPATDLAAVAASPAVEGPANKRSRFRFLTSAKAAAGLVIVGFFVILAIIGPWIAPYNPDKRGRDLVKGPSWHHWFGTTHLGQDIFSQVLVGTRAVVYVGFASSLIAGVLSVLVGVTAGYLGGLIDDLLSSLTNVFLVIPGLLLIIIITVSIPDVNNTVIAIVIGITSWAWGARVLRAQTMSLRRRDYIEAARASGETTWRIIGFEVMPNLSAIIASSFVGTAIYAVLSEITLAFIGIGGNAGWNWGTILYWAQGQAALPRGAWWWFVPASLAIALLGTGLALLNFGIDEFISPRLRSAGKTSIKMLNGHKVRMRVGFTPVLSAPAVASSSNGSLSVNGAVPTSREVHDSTEVHTGIDMRSGKDIAEGTAVNNGTEGAAR
jgi:peptide/nickel transport system permease protein